MANKKTNRPGRYQIKANPELMLAFDLECKKAGTNRSARFEILMRRDITVISAEQADAKYWQDGVEIIAETTGGAE